MDRALPFDVAQDRQRKIMPEKITCVSPYHREGEPFRTFFLCQGTVRRSLRSRAHPEHPILLSRVLSPSHREYDLTAKRRLYERVGVAEYWVTDPEQHTLEVDRFSKDEEPVVLCPDDTLMSPLFRGWKLPLAHLLREA